MTRPENLHSLIQELRSIIYTLESHDKLKPLEDYELVKGERVVPLVPALCHCVFLLKEAEMWLKENDVELATSCVGRASGILWVYRADRPPDRHNPGATFRAMGA